MFFSIHKFLFQPSKTQRKETKDSKGEEKNEAEEKLSPCLGCLNGPCLGHDEHTNSKHRVAAINVTSARAARSDFAKFTTSTLFSNSHFTNHESIPSLLDSFFHFAEAFPLYHETQLADDIRESEYGHLADHVCLDYSGVNLFSHAQMNQSIATSSSSPPPPSAWRPPFFSISYKSASLKSEVKYGEKDSGFEFAIRKRIMSFLKISGEDYGIVCTANRTAAFRLLGETYPFQSNKRLLTVYDYESEAVSAMVESAEKRGAKVMSASFSWPGMRIQTAKMKKMLSKRKTEKKRGLLVFPHMSRMTGVRYPYLWMKLARENGWHVILDACTLGPKDMDTLGITLIQPDFIICSFFKVFGENPAGFAALFIKKSSKEVLQTSILARSIGMVSIVRAGKLSDLPEEEVDTTSSFSGPIPSNSKQKQSEIYEEGETSEPGGPPVSTEAEEEEEDKEQQEAYEYKEEKEEEEEEELSSEIAEVLRKTTKHNSEEIENQVEVEFNGLDHADSLGLRVIHNRLRCITNWLVIALTKLQHPHSENGNSLVKIYGPRVKFDRGPALAFNVFDWKGEKVNPVLVQKLADRSNISLSCGFLQKIEFLEKYEHLKDTVLEERVLENTIVSDNKKKEDHNLGIAVVNASFGYLANFEDAYRLWAFVAKFLDADFVEKERWRYVALNQKMIEL
ncbi:hypothetical protein KFK09_010016 [Dendrobium nobile]|uniref:Molybdenum cofactor sulfurase n=1 Tax=Dendrobium nobile TaxID=94219 RepID=A0A8T3BJ03_DENNO|nr:hypothetical protein KFK09_010016 [Dendrobium nobile]